MLAVHQPLICKIQFCGDLDRQSLSRIFTIAAIESVDEDGRKRVTLQGMLPDYAALYGVLNYLYEQGLALISVEVLLDRMNG